MFQLIPNDRSLTFDCSITFNEQVASFILEQCASTGLYLQGSDKQRSTQCTYLQQGHHYVTEGNSLFLNFYSRISTVRGGFWITYEGKSSTFINSPFVILMITFCIRDFQRIVLMLMSTYIVDHVKRLECLGMHHQPFHLRPFLRQIKVGIVLL